MHEACIKEDVSGWHRKSKINNILILKCDHDGQGIMRTPSHRGDKENIPGFVSDEIRGQNENPPGCGSHKM